MKTEQITLLAIRVVAFLVAGSVGFWHPFSASPDPALSAALLSLALAIAVYTLVDLLWAQLLIAGGAGEAPDVATTWGPLVGLLVTTAGVILGLLSAFGQGHLSVTLQVGTLSLVASVVLGLILFGMVVSATPTGDWARMFSALVFNITTWALTLGLLCIGWALVDR